MARPPLLLWGFDHNALRQRVSLLLEHIPEQMRFIYGQEKNLGIDEVREMRRKAGLATHVGEQAFVVYRADSMTREAANALLKILEEPPASVFCILVARVPWALPETLRSRLEVVRVLGSLGGEFHGATDRDEAFTTLEENLIEVREKLHIALIKGDRKTEVYYRKIRRGLMASELLTSSSVAPKYIMDLYTIGE